MNPFYIYLTFDIDQDFNPSSLDYYNRTAGKFDAFGEEFAKLIKVLDGKSFSVFVRSDHQINVLYGRYDYLFSHNPSLIKYIKESNGELNWHIHIYEQEGEEWVPVKDKNLAKCFRIDLAEVKKNPYINWKVVRIGECVMTQELMNEIAANGILIDSTALPGRARDDSEKHFDWQTTTNAPYHPSANDYRISASDKFQLIEAPMTTIKMQASYDKSPMVRYFNLSFKTEVLFQNFAEYVNNNNSLISITHPFEVISKGEHGLISFSKDVFTENLKRLEKEVIKHGKQPVFKHISEMII